MTNHRAPDTSDTDLGVGRNGIAAPAPKPARTYDLNNADDVFDLAQVTALAPNRRLMQVTFAQWRAVARLAVSSSVIASHAINLAQLKLKGAPQAEQDAALAELLKAAVPL